MNLSDKNKHNTRRDKKNVYKKEKDAFNKDILP